MAQDTEELSYSHTGASTTWKATPTSILLTTIIANTDKTQKAIEADLARNTCGTASIADAKCLRPSNTQPTQHQSDPVDMFKMIEFSHPPLPVLLVPPTWNPTGHSPLQKGAVPDQKFTQKELGSLHWHQTFEPPQQHEPSPQLLRCIAL
jgi:hypothetical protein